MRDTAGQLILIRRTGRIMLIAQRLLQWLCLMVALIMFLGAVDYLLRFPSWFRFIIDLAVIFASGTWLLSRLSYAARFRPSLDELAVRAERVFPQLSGLLASAIAFTIHEDQYRQPAGTAALAKSTVARATSQVSGLKLYRMLNPRRMIQSGLPALIAVSALVLVMGMAPASSRIAAGRWLLPFGSVEWPNRVHVRDMTDQHVSPIDSPIRLAAAIERGYYPGMRVRVNYRLVGSDALSTGDDTRLVNWQSVLMTEQRSGSTEVEGGDRPGRYERLIELPWSLSYQTIEAGGHRGSLEYSIQAGDSRTPVRRITLVNRPGITRVTADIRPPGYARGLVARQVVNLHEQSAQVATASALTGSEVTFRIEFNKPLDHSLLELESAVPGFATISGINVKTTTTESEPDPGRTMELVIQFTIRDTVESQIQLVDEYGLSSYSDRRYRMESVTDESPSVSLVSPAADESVLPTALIDLAAVAQDDVGLELLTIESRYPQAGGSADNPGQVDEAVAELARQTGRQGSLSVEAVMDLSTLTLQSGDVITLYGLCRDVYDLFGERHDLVRSSPRRLYVIDEAGLIGQLRSELAGVRQQSIRLELAQRQLEQLPPDRSLPQQAQITHRLAAQHTLVKSLQDRVSRNRLDEPTIEQLMTASSELLNQAVESGSRAEASLDAAMDEPDRQQEHMREAERDQAELRDTLKELISLLDQAKDALDLQLQLRQLQSLQDSLAADTRKQLPQTVGQNLDQLPDDQRKALREMGQRQRNLSEQADTMIRNMQATAEAMSKQGESDQDQATAQALAEAAAIARRQGLVETMEESSDSIDQNKLSQAGQQQLDTLDVLQQMLREMGNQQKRMQAMLKRRLQKLEQLVEEIIRRQKHQLELLVAAADDSAVAALEQAQSAVRLSTMSAEEQSRLSSDTLVAAESLAAAVGRQADAIMAIRQMLKLQAGNAERAAIEHLEAALELLKQVRRQTEEDLVRQEREKLKEAYEQLARRQDELTGEVTPLADVPTLSRKQKSDLRAVSQSQQGLQHEAGKLKEQVDKTLVFEQMHRRIDEALGRVVNKLGRAIADEVVLLDQSQVSTMLWAMADALDEDRREQEFAGESSSGGSGGGGGMAPPLVPPVAELKLLKAMQGSVYERTRAIDSSVTRPLTDPDQQRLLELSTQQRELSALGQRLIDKLKQSLPSTQEMPRELQ